MSEWQDIETAPRDGSMVLLYNVAHQEMAVMGWTDDYMADEFPGGVWTDAGGKNQAVNVVGNGGFFQYWQPLPPPPTT